MKEELFERKKGLKNDEHSHTIVFFSEARDYKPSSKRPRKDEANIKERSSVPPKSSCSL